MGGGGEMGRRGIRRRITEENHGALFHGESFTLLRHRHQYICFTVSNPALPISYMW